MTGDHLGLWRRCGCCPKRRYIARRSAQFEGRSRTIRLYRGSMCSRRRYFRRRSLSVQFGTNQHVEQPTVVFGFRFRCSSRLYIAWQMWRGKLCRWFPTEPADIGEPPSWLYWTWAQFGTPMRLCRRWSIVLRALGRAVIAGAGRLCVAGDSGDTCRGEAGGSGVGQVAAGIDLRATCTAAGRSTPVHV